MKLCQGINDCKKVMFQERKKTFRPPNVSNIFKLVWTLHEYSAGAELSFSLCAVVTPPHHVQHRATLCLALDSAFPLLPLLPLSTAWNFDLAPWMTSNAATGGSTTIDTLSGAGKGPCTSYRFGRLAGEMRWRAINIHKPSKLRMLRKTWNEQKAHESG